MNDAEKYLIMLRGPKPIGIPAGMADDGRPWLEQLYDGYIRLFQAVVRLEKVVYCQVPQGQPIPAPDPTKAVIATCGGADKSGSPPPPSFPP
jgi:hypothetical protein